MNLVLEPPSVTITTGEKEDTSVLVGMTNLVKVATIWEETGREEGEERVLNCWGAEFRDAWL